eukprot:scaffold5.g907.t1
MYLSAVNMAIVSVAPPNPAFKTLTIIGRGALGGTLLAGASRGVAHAACKDARSEPTPWAAAGEGSICLHPPPHRAVKDGLDDVREMINAPRCQFTRVADRLEVLKQQEKEAVERFKLQKNKGDKDGEDIYRRSWHRILDEIELLLSGDLKAYEQWYSKL